MKRKISNECLHQCSNDNGVRILKFGSLNNLILRTRWSHTETFICTSGHL